MVHSLIVLLMLLATIQNPPPQQTQKAPEPPPTTVDPEISTQFLRVHRICVESFGNDPASIELQAMVINALSDREHPCQILADLLTLYERRGSLEGLRLAYVGDGNNVAHSLALAAPGLGIDVRFACPDGYEPDSRLMEQAQAGAPAGAIELFRDPREAVSGADAVYTDTWYSMGQESEAEMRAPIFKRYQLNAELLACAASGAIAMHCLPAHRNQEITDEVMDGPASVVYDQAENRLHAQKALLLRLLGAI